MSRSAEWPTEDDGACDDDADGAEVLGTVVGGRYRVVKKLGQGGMGAVFLARQEALGRDVALKIVRGELARVPRHVERFRREAKTLSQLAHPNIVALYDFGEDATALWFAMELLRGESLRDRLRARGALSVDESVAIVRDICAALIAAHERGVLHRDLKPDNVMVVDTGAPGSGQSFVKLVDFGIAKAVGDAPGSEGTPLTQTGTVVGTPGYVPREISVDGIHDDPRSDLYSLGVTWFEMLTGEHPFKAQTAVGLMMKHASDAPPHVATVAPHVAPRISALVDRLLAKERDARPASAQAVLALLDEMERAPAAFATPTPRTDSFASLRPPEPIVAVTAPFLDASVAGVPSIATAVTVISKSDASSSSSSSSAPELHIERVASLRLRTLVVVGALACGLALAAAIVFAIDEPAPRAREQSAMPRAIIASPEPTRPAAATVVEHAPTVERPAAVERTSGARRPPTRERAPVEHALELAPVERAPRESPKLLEDAPKLLLDDKPKLMD